MNELDKVFQDSYQSPRPATPPANGWAGVAAGTSAPPPPASLTKWSYLLTTVFLLLGATVIWAIVTGEQTDHAVAQESVTHSQLTDSPEGKAGHATTARRRAAATQVGLSTKGGAAVSSSVSTRLAPDATASVPSAASSSARSSLTKLADDKQFLPDERLPLPVGSNDEPTSDVDAVQTNATGSGVAPLICSPASPPVKSEHKQFPLRNLPTPVPASPDGPVQRTPTAGHWEGSLRVGAHFGKRSTLVTTYRLSEPSATTREFLVDEGLIYGSRRAVFPDIQRTFYWGLAAAGLSRQFANGLRLGTELLFEREERSLYLSPAALIADQLPQGSDFAVYEESWREDYSLVLNAGYTFRRHRRLQFYAGATFISRFSRSGSIGERVLRYSDGQTFGAGSQSVFIREIGYDLRVLPQVGASYLLTESVRIGLLTGPGLSVQVGYRF